MHTPALLTLSRCASVSVVALLVAGLTPFASAAADDLTDLKAMIQNMNQQIKDLQAKQADLAKALAAAQAAQASSAVPPAQTPAVTTGASPPAAPVVTTVTGGTVASAAPAAKPAGQQAPTQGISIPIVSGLDLKLYGRADIALTSSYGSSSNGENTTNYRLNQGQMTSRLGLTGGYQLDDDFRAIFGIESGVTLYSGNAGGGAQEETSGSLLFNRGATGGFVVKDIGSIEGGLMYMAPFWVMLGADHASAHNYGDSDFSALFSLGRPEALGKYLSQPKDSNTIGGVGNGNTGYNNSGTALFYGNALRYRTPAFSGMLDGLDAEISYSGGQQLFNFNSNGSQSAYRDDGRTFAGNIEYKTHELYLGYAHMEYMQVANTNSGVVGAPTHFATRDETTDILGARYKWRDLEVGAAYTFYSASQSGGYSADSYGFSGAYDIGKHRIEASVARITYSNANGSGLFGKNLGDGKGDPETTALALGYLYNIWPTWSFYVYGTQNENNAHAKLGVIDFRGDANFFGKDAAELTTGTFFTF